MKGDLAREGFRSWRASFSERLGLPYLRAPCFGDHRSMALRHSTTSWDRFSRLPDFFDQVSKFSCVFFDSVFADKAASIFTGFAGSEVILTPTAS